MIELCLADRERGGLKGFFFSSRRRHTRLQGDWSSDVCSSDLRRWGTRPSQGCASGSSTMAAGGVLIGSRRLWSLFRPPPERNLMDLYAIIRREGWVSPGEIGRASCRERV